VKRCSPLEGTRSAFFFSRSSQRFFLSRTCHRIGTTPCVPFPLFRRGLSLFFPGSAEGSIGSLIHFLSTRTLLTNSENEIELDRFFSLRHCGTALGLGLQTAFLFFFFLRAADPDCSSDLAFLWFLRARDRPLFGGVPSPFFFFTKTAAFSFSLPEGIFGACRQGALFPKKRWEVHFPPVRDTWVSERHVFPPVHAGAVPPTSVQQKSARGLPLLSGRLSASPSRSPLPEDAITAFVPSEGFRLERWSLSFSTQVRSFPPHAEEFARRLCG